MSDTVTELTLTDGQQKALDEFVQFLLDPEETVMVLAGYSGTGKTTLVHTLLDRLPGYIKSVKLIQDNFPDYTIQLTATTNKAAETFARVTGMDVRTIHSFLGLRLQKDFRTGATSMVPKSQVKQSGYLLFIDEASMIDPSLLGHIFSLTEHCKIVLIGDPAQLTPVKLSYCPAFQAGFKEAKLTEVMRQMVNGKPQANPITEMATAFRHTVNTGEWPKGLKPDGEYIIYLPRDEFMARIEEEFTRDDWTYKDSKVLAWTNNCVIAYNKHIRALLKGDPALQPGDYAENNSFISVKNHSVKTDQTVYISSIEDDTEEMGVQGNWVVLDSVIRVFHPKLRAEKNKLVARLRAEGQFARAEEVSNWVDLRAVFAQTINKSQGSTYGKVFIDLDDIKRCNSGNQIARMMYVGTSRAQNQVYMTGDLV